jgi:eukaryotic-like serine/threonine-protein kinase
MALTPGSRFGVFEIVGRIGAGGMGEVYRARDTRLRRDVAIKVLPQQLTDDAARVARFEREAQSLAALNHPHIAQVYGLEDGPSPTSGQPTRAIVMELVEGEDLSDRTKHGPTRVAETVAIAKQIVDAIGAAHDAGIIHRDLKPANVRVRNDGVVKVLDFGLARLDASRLPADPVAPTTTDIATVPGVILGTPAYMSPEQARGQAADARSDIWAFGCVLYELLTGRQAFAAATTSDTIARILEREPDWGALPSSTPTALRRLLQRCLTKDPKRRLHALADAHFDLDDALASDTSAVAAGSSPAIARSSRWLALTLLVAAATAALATIWWRDRTGAPAPPPQVLPLTSYPGIEATPTFSPDGRQVAFSWDGDRLDNEDIYVMVVGADTPHRITSDPARDISPVWKPDGTQIAFARVNDDRIAIYVAAALGGSEQRLAEFPGVMMSTAPRGSNDPFVSWSADGRWLVVSRIASDEGRSAIYLVAHDGSERQTLLPASPTSDYAAAAFSPGGSALAYVDSGHIGIAEIALGSPATFRKAPRRLTDFQGYVGGLAWTSDGREILYGRAAYASPTPPYLWRVAADGSSAPQRIDLAGVASFPAVAATGRLAFSRRDLNVDMAVLAEGGGREAIAASTFNEFDASFSPDGSKIAFASDRTGEGNELWIVNRDGSGRRSVTRGKHRPEGSPRWSPDGRRLAFDGLGDDGQRHVYLVDAEGGEIRALAPKRGFFDQIPSWSRDQQWIYFGSNRSGQSEIWRVRVSGGDPEQLTTTGGGVPMESWDGKTLYFSKVTRGGRAVFVKPVAGGLERALGLDVVFWNYFVGKDGLYYTSLPSGRRAPFTYELRLLDGSGKSRRLHEVQLASMSPGLSVTEDGRFILIAGVSDIGQDLLRIEHFR